MAARNPTGQVPPRREFLRWAATAGMATALPGCWLVRPAEPPPVPAHLVNPGRFSFFSSPAYSAAPPRRVLLLPVQATVRPVTVQQDFASQFAAQLRAGQLFEVLLDPALGSCSCDIDTILRGRFSEYRLLEITDRYHADALLVTRVNQMQGVAPIEAAVTCALIDRNEAVVLAAADGHWSTADQATSAAWHSWLDSQCLGAPPGTIAVWRQSPRHFQSFIAWQITRRLAEPLGVDLNGAGAAPCMSAHI